MEEYKSILINKICELNLPNRYFKPLLVKGQKCFYENKVKCVFSPRKDEVISIVSDNDDIKENIVYFKKSFNKSIDMKCSCYEDLTCIHEIATMLYICQNASELDATTGINDPVYGMSFPDVFQIYNYLKRLIGPRKIVVEQTVVDFEIYLNRLVNELTKKINSNIDKTVTAQLFINCLDLLYGVRYIKLLTEKESINKLIPVFVDVFNLNSKTELGFFDSFIKNINASNLKAISYSLIKYSEKYETNDTYNRIVDRIVQKVENFNSTNNIDISESINGVISLKANNLFLIDKNEFLEFGLKHCDLDDIRLLVLKMFLKDGKYEEIRSLWNQYKDQKNTHYDEEAMIFLSAMRELDYDKYSSGIKEVFLLNPTYDTYTFLDERNLLDSNVIDEILLVLDDKCSLEDKICIYKSNKMYGKIVECCLKEKSYERRLFYFHEFFSDLVKVNEKDVLLTYQNDIVTYYLKTKDLNMMIYYLSVFDSLPLGIYYKYNVVKYIVSGNHTSYLENEMLNRYMKGLDIR